MAKKFLRMVAGAIEEIVATVTSTGVAEAGDVVALDANGRLDQSVMPVGIGADIVNIEASENLAAGDMVNVWDDGGTPKVRKASAGAIGTQAHGFVISAVTSGQNGNIYFEGNNNQVTGLTGGTTYYLDAAVAGGLTATPPSSTGDIVQRVGIATSATNINIEIGQPIVVA
jgi:hypothetical protein